MLEKRYSVWVDNCAFRSHGLLDDNHTGKNGISPEVISQEDSGGNQNMTGFYDCFWLYTITRW